MHQHPRPAPRSASAASNPNTNPEQTNNQREGAPPHRTRSSVDLASYTERAGQAGAQPARPESTATEGSQDRETTKLNQIIQHFHTKAALMICSARANLPPVRNRNGDLKQDRWFNIVLDDTDVLLDALQEWKRPDLTDRPPPPLVIEVYVDSSSLSSNQALVLTDEGGRRWDVAEALSASGGSSPGPTTRNGSRNCEVVLERWTVGIGDLEGLSPSEQASDHLPNVYKKGVVVFRSLYTLLRMLPTWRLHRRPSRDRSNGLRLKYRLTSGDAVSSSGSSHKLQPTANNTTIKSTTSVSAFTTSKRTSPRNDDPAPSYTRLALGRVPHHRYPLDLAVSYLESASIDVADAEALISSRFLRDNELPAVQGNYSLPTSRSSLRDGGKTHSRTTSYTSTTAPREPRALLGTYSSLGTFHATGRRESPLSALQNQQSSYEESGSDTIDHIYKLTAEDRMEREELQKRSSATKSPFKAGSLSGSPRAATPQASTEAVSSPKYSSASKRDSLNALPQQALRIPPGSLPNETAVASSSGSSPVPKYTSAFAGRTKRNSSNTDKGSGGSSGRASEVKSDEEYIQDFVGLLESEGVKRLTIKPRHSVSLVQFKRMKDGNEELAESMSASRALPEREVTETEEQQPQQQQEEEDEEDEVPFIFQAPDI